MSSWKLRSVENIKDIEIHVHESLNGKKIRVSAYQEAIFCGYIERDKAFFLSHDLDSFKQSFAKEVSRDLLSEIKSVHYEWACEYVDQYGDIELTRYGKFKKEVWPADVDVNNPLITHRLCVVRYYGCEANGEEERGYAYVGDKRFCSGQKIPEYLFNQLNRE